MERLDFFNALHQADMFRRLARGAEDLVVSFVTDEQDRVIFLGEADSFEMDLGDERASGIDSSEAALGGGGADGRGDAVSAIQHRRALGHFFDVIYEEDTAFAKALDHRAIVDDLMVDIQRGAVDLQGALQALDGHVHPSTEAARIGENDLHDNSSFACKIASCGNSRHANASRNLPGTFIKQRVWQQGDVAQKTTTPPEWVALRGNPTFSWIIRFRL